MPLDGEVAPVDRAAQRGRRPDRGPTHGLVRLAQLGQPAGLLQRQGSVVVRSLGDACVGPEIEGLPGVEDVRRHAVTMPENVADESVTEVDG